MEKLEKKYQEIFSSHPSVDALYSTEDGQVFVAKADAEAHAQDVAIKKNHNQPPAWQIDVVARVVTKAAPLAKDADAAAAPEPKKPEVDADAAAVPSDKNTNK